MYKQLFLPFNPIFKLSHFTPYFNDNTVFRLFCIIIGISTHTLSLYLLSLSPSFCLSLPQTAWDASHVKFLFISFHFGIMNRNSIMNLYVLAQADGATFPLKVAQLHINLQTNTQTYILYKLRGVGTFCSRVRLHLAVAFFFLRFC